MAADLPRRTVLGLGAAAALAGLAAGCGTPAASSPRARRAGSRGSTGSDLEAAAADEHRLIAAYDELLPLASAADRRLLRTLRDQHAAHLTRLAPAAGSPASSAAAPRVRTPAELAQLERASSRRLAGRALDLAEGDTAALLASIGASHAGHGEALRGVRPAAASRHRRTGRSGRHR